MHWLGLEGWDLAGGGTSVCVLPAKQKRDICIAFSASAAAAA